MITNTPEQAVAIKKMMAARARHLHTHQAGSFPKFNPGRTTTAEYVQLYSIGRDVLPLARFSHHASHPAPFLTADHDQVQVEHDAEVIA